MRRVRVTFRSGGYWRRGWVDGYVVVGDQIHAIVVSDENRIVSVILDHLELSSDDRTSHDG